MGQRAIRRLIGLLTIYGELPPLLQRIEDGVLLPMKRGIVRDLSARYPDLPIRKLNALRRTIALSRAYCRAILAEGAQRHDLDGNPVQPVEEEARQLAERQLEQLKAARQGQPRAMPRLAATPPPATPRLGPSGRPILSLKVRKPA